MYLLRRGEGGFAGEERRANARMPSPCPPPEGASQVTVGFVGSVLDAIIVLANGITTGFHRTSLITRRLNLGVCCSKPSILLNEESILVGRTRLHDEIDEWYLFSSTTK